MLTPQERRAIQALLRTALRLRRQLKGSRDIVDFYDGLLGREQPEDDDSLFAQTVA